MSVVVAIASEYIGAARAVNDESDWMRAWPGGKVDKAAENVFLFGELERVSTGRCPTSIVIASRGTVRGQARQ